MRQKRKVTEEQAFEWYDDFLDENYPMEIGGWSWPASEVIKHFDFVAYREGAWDYINGLADMNNVEVV